MREAARSKQAEGCVVLILNVGSALFPLRPALPQVHDRDFYPTIPWRAVRSHGWLTASSARESEHDSPCVSATRSIRRLGDVGRVVRRTERAPENAKPGPEGASPIGASPAGILYVAGLAPSADSVAGVEPGLLGAQTRLASRAHSWRLSRMSTSRSMNSHSLVCRRRATSSSNAGAC